MAGCGASVCRVATGLLLALLGAGPVCAQDPARTRLAQARALADQGQIEASLSALRAAVFLHRGDVEISREYQNAMVRSGRREEVVREYRALAEAFPDEATWRYLHGRLLEGAALEQEFLAALRLDPDFYWARIGLGQYYLDHRRYADAIPHLRRAESLQPGRIEAVDALAKAHHLAGEFEAAEAVWRGAVSRFPRSPEPRVGLGVLYKTIGRGDPSFMPRAIEQLEAVVKDWPRTWEAYAPLIQACYAIGDAARADRYREAARRLGRELGKDEMIVDAVDAGSRVLVISEALRDGDLWLWIAAAPKGAERVEPARVAFVVRKEGGAMDLHGVDPARPREPGPFLARFLRPPSHAELVAKLRSVLK